MNKSSFFSGQPVFAQLIDLIPDTIIARLAERHKADRYYKTFRSRDHLMAMLYACFHQCTSLREVTTGLQASYNKLNHLGIKNVPCRSTLSDANRKRTVDFFEDLYHELYALYYRRLPDSRPARSKESRLFIMDSTTITLFSEAMKGVGCFGADGRRKGGVKAHVVLDGYQDVPQLIYITDGSRNDRVLMGRVRLNKGDILAFDKGYHNFAQWDEWTAQGITWVTRLTEHEVFNIINEKIIPESQQHEGVCRDIEVLLGAGTSPSAKVIRARIVCYYVASHRKIYHFLTNNFRFSPASVAGIYQKRWRVETFFKRIKQTSPVKYFLGDNDNAIRIQLWCAFIKDLLIKVVKEQLTRKWSFANLSSMIRHHLMNYLNLKKFLNYPDKIKIAMFQPNNHHLQMKLFPP